MDDTNVKGEQLEIEERKSVDEGARRALQQRNSSLLPAGVISVAGSFTVGDSVSIVSEAGIELARGLARYDAGDVKLLAGGHSQQIADRVANHLGDEIVHRDDIVLTKKGA